MREADRQADRNRALVAARRLEVGTRVRHVVGVPRIYVVVGYTRGWKVRVESEADRSLHGAFSPEFLERADTPPPPTAGDATHGS